jgi:hypothetical protein
MLVTAAREPPKSAQHWGDEAIRGIGSSPGSDIIDYWNLLSTSQ